MIYSSVLPFIEQSKLCGSGFIENFDLTQVYFPLTLTPDLQKVLDSVSYSSSSHNPLVIHVQPLDIYIIDAVDPLFALWQLSKKTSDVTLRRVDYSNVAEQLVYFRDTVENKEKVYIPSHGNTGDVLDIQNCSLILKAKLGQVAEEKDLVSFSLSSEFEVYENLNLEDNQVQIEEHLEELDALAFNLNKEKRKLFKKLNEELSDDEKSLDLSYTGQVNDSSVIMAFLTSYLLEPKNPPKVPMIQSNSGMGKSSIIKSLANKLGFRMVDIRAAFMLPLDFKGLAEVVAEDNQTTTTYAPSAKLLECSDAGIYFARSTVEKIKVLIQDIVETLPKEFSSQNLEQVLKLDVSKEDKTIQDIVSRLKNLAYFQAKYEEKSKRPLLFLDEYTRAIPMIQGAFFEIFTDRKFADQEMTLAKVLAATNFPVGIDPELASNMFPGVGLVENPAALNRFLILNVTENDVIPDWLVWAGQTNKETGKQNIHPSVYKFLQDKKYQIYDFKVVENAFNASIADQDPRPQTKVATTPFPNFRTWEMVSNYLYSEESKMGATAFSSTENVGNELDITSTEDAQVDKDSSTFSPSSPLTYIAKYTAKDRYESGPRTGVIRANSKAREQEEAKKSGLTFEDRGSEVEINSSGEKGVVKSYDVSSEIFDITTSTGDQKVYKKDVTLIHSKDYLLSSSSGLVSYSDSVKDKTSQKLNSKLPVILPTALEKLVGIGASNDFLKSGFYKCNKKLTKPETSMTDVTDAALSSNTPLLLAGSSSLGKSARVYQWAEKNNAEVITILLSQTDPALVMGRPDTVKAIDYMAGSVISSDSKIRNPQTGLYDDKVSVQGMDGKPVEINQTRYAQSNLEKSEPELYHDLAVDFPPALAKSFTTRVPDRKLKSQMEDIIFNKKKTCIIYFDEVNICSTPAVMSAIFECYSDSRVFGIDFSSFKDRVRIVCACNLKGSGVLDLDTAFGARFMTFAKEKYDISDAKAYLNYAETKLEKGEFSPILYKHLKALSPTDLLDFLSSVDQTDQGQKYAESTALPSSRSFETLSQFLSSDSYSYLRGSLVWADLEVDSRFNSIETSNLALDTSKDKLRDLCDLVSSRLSNWTCLRSDPNGYYATTLVGTLNASGPKIKELFEYNYNLAFKDASVSDDKKLKSCNSLMVLIKAMRDMEKRVEDKRRETTNNIIGPEAGSKFLNFYNPLSGMDGDMYEIPDLGDLKLIPVYWKQQYALADSSVNEGGRINLINSLSLEFTKFWSSKPEFKEDQCLAWLNSLLSPIPQVDVQKDAVISLTTNPDTDIIFYKLSEDSQKIILTQVYGAKEVDSKWNDLIASRNPEAQKTISTGNLFPMDESFAAKLRKFGFAV